MLNTGHRHRRVLEAVRAQLDKVTHTCFQITPYEPYVALCEKLNALARGKGPNKSVLMSTGAEAVENAVKIARAATRRAAVIGVRQGGFHGRTDMALALTGKIDPYKAGFGPYPAEVYHAPFPSALHGISVRMLSGRWRCCSSATWRPTASQPSSVEPVQGEGGFYVAPKEFIVRLRGYRDRHGIMLIADEIQSGAGRTGGMFAIGSTTASRPTCTRSPSRSAADFPLSAVVGRAEVMDACGPGGLGGTYAGNPVACAAALAVLQVLRESGSLSARTGSASASAQALDAMASRHLDIVEVRRLGAMIAFELGEGGDPHRPAAGPHEAAHRSGRA